ncbi:MAG: aminoacyl-tRNA hydrolase [Spirochaetes bacterium]|nr:aminoacyl-tRNA hydrolase [Spirochaetota bacterium]
MFGLGNPGERYARTRHNAGFQVVDMLAGRLGVEPRRRLFRSYVIWKGRHAGRPLALVKPLTFMNDSGRVFREALRETGGGVPDLLVVCDSLDLSPGSLRFRLRGSAGGHKGLASISRHLGTDDFMRLLVGIGRPAHRGQVVEYVLDEPRADEEPLVAGAVQRAADAVLLLLAEGPERVMNEYNRREPPA